MRNNEVLRDVRVALGLSLREAAALLVISPVGLGRLERGLAAGPHPMPLPDADLVRMVYLLLAPHREAVRARAKVLASMGFPT